MTIGVQYERLLARVRESGTAASHVVAFSGGVDSSLVAHAVHEVFPVSSLAILGLSPSLSTEQQEMAEQMAAHIGIPLETVKTREGEDPRYIANRGESCYACKSALYTSMEDFIRAAKARTPDAVLFNGTNADDLLDPTRVGLVAAIEHDVVSPLRDKSKQDVRALARHAGLPNWNTAASPCLRSRLQFGVEATPDNLRRIEEGERLLRLRFGIGETVNFRVRHLPGDEAMIETDLSMLPFIDLHDSLQNLSALGFLSVAKRPYRTGAAAVPTASVPKPASSME